MNQKTLIRYALKAKEAAYAPYSNFKVGAAILTDDEKIYTGCNIEISSYSPTICAERTAIFKAVSEGHRKIRAIAIIGDVEFTYPCGVCRQVISEFAKDVILIIAKSEDEYREYTLEELFPHSFGPEYLKIGSDNKDV